MQQQQVPAFFPLGQAAQYGFVREVREVRSPDPPNFVYPIPMYVRGDGPNKLEYFLALMPQATGLGFDSMLIKRDLIAMFLENVNTRVKTLQEMKAKIADGSYRPENAQALVAKIDQLLATAAATPTHPLNGTPADGAGLRPWPFNRSMFVDVDPNLYLGSAFFGFFAGFPTNDVMVLPIWCWTAIAFLEARVSGKIQEAKTGVDFTVILTEKLRADFGNGPEEIKRGFGVVDGTAHREVPASPDRVTTEKLQYTGENGRVYTWAQIQVLARQGNAAAKIIVDGNGARVYRVYTNQGVVSVSFIGREACIGEIAQRISDRFARPEGQGDPPGPERFAQPSLAPPPAFASGPVARQVELDTAAIANSIDLQVLAQRVHKDRMEGFKEMRGNGGKAKFLDPSTNNIILAQPASNYYRSSDLYVQGSSSQPFNIAFKYEWANGQLFKNSPMPSDTVAQSLYNQLYRYIAMSINDILARSAIEPEPQGPQRVTGATLESLPTTAPPVSLRKPLFEARPASMTKVPGVRRANLAAIRQPPCIASLMESAGGMTTAIDAAAQERFRALIGGVLPEQVEQIGSQPVTLEGVMADTSGILGGTGPQPAQGFGAAPLGTRPVPSVMSGERS